MQTPRLLRLNCVSGAFALLLRCASLAAVELPERPANFLFDQGSVFPQEIAQRLSIRLQECARDHDIDIYAITLPTLQVMPSRVREKLEELGSAATEKWLKDRVGAVIVFDNEAGWVTIGISERAEREFSSVSLNMVLKDPLMTTRKRRLSPDKLEAAAIVLVDGLVELKMNSLKEQRRHSVVRFAFIAVLLIATILVGLSFWNKPRSADTLRE